MLASALSNVISRSSSLPPTAPDHTLRNINPAWPPDAIRDTVTSSVIVPDIVDIVLGLVSADNTAETYDYNTWIYKTYNAWSVGDDRDTDEETMLAESVEKATCASINADIIATATSTATDAYSNIFWPVSRRAYARRAATYLATTKRLYSLWKHTDDKHRDDVLATLYFAFMTSSASVSAHNKYSGCQAHMICTLLE